MLRLSDDRSGALVERLAAVYRAEAVENWAACLVIVSDHKVEPLIRKSGRDRTFVVPSPSYPSGHGGWGRAQAILDGRCQI